MPLPIPLWTPTGVLGLEIWNVRTDRVLSCLLRVEGRPLGTLAIALRLLAVLGRTGEGCKTVNFSSASFRAAASLFCSRNSAPGDVALTEGTPLAVARRLRLVEVKFKLLVDLGVRRVL